MVETIYLDRSLSELVRRGRALDKEFYMVAKELGDFIRDLQLDQPENDRLIELIIKQVVAAEQGAFDRATTTGYPQTTRRNKH